MDGYMNNGWDDWLAGWIGKNEIFCLIVQKRHRWLMYAHIDRWMEGQIGGICVKNVDE